ncbi:copper chaperone PCu(A)C [Sphingomonas sp. SUN019]|uniref:copper chaperone PCu(A)C n=1 Tax=Sphingomonas sp. SUN019 TaxID=2937788 RepID=UPI002164562B|nr:copper chaperone PCu(A)C [Sphingomonas sp. SUN019]UVO49992.1 copper chaperone PCu(A)C [Sphingomonas sp. SUN019]
MRHLVTLALAAAALAGCAQEKQLYVSDAWVRLAAVPGRPAAGYFTIHGGPTDATLISVSTDVAIRTEMHESKMAAGGGMTMDAVRSLPIPALQTVRFAPGGKHVMLFDVNPSVKPGAAITFTYTFADALRIQQDARVIAAGDPPPKK